MTLRSRTRTRLRLPALVAVALLAATGCTQSSDTATRPTGTAGAATGSSTSSASADGAVTLMGAGDIGGNKEAASATGDLIRNADPDAVFTTGDNAYPDGSRANYLERYEPTWGSFKARTHPVPGNHEYHTDVAAGYLDYFGVENVTNPVDGRPYYAWDVGNGWRAYAMNTEIDVTGGQLEWLREDVAAHPDMHYILYAHRPRFTSSDEHGPSAEICPLWDTLAETGGLEIVLAGHNHQYERFAPMNCDGRADADGARSFVVGSGGKALYGFGEPQQGSEFRNNSDFGVLRLVLSPTSYEWEFIASGVGYEDEGHVDMGNAGAILDKGTAEV